MKRTRRNLAAVAVTSAVLLAFAAIGNLGAGCELVVQVSAPLDGAAEDVVPGVCPICGPGPDGSSDEDGGDASTSPGRDSEAGSD